MTSNQDQHKVTSLSALEALYGKVNPGSLTKETDHLTAPYRGWLEQAPFMAIASAGQAGLDCSPRGDAQGQLFRVENVTTIAVPDRRGNNRLDTLRNIIDDPRVALLFLIPGINEALRINGRASISTEPSLLDSFDVNNHKPATVILVAIEAVYFQCARALVRARMWDSSAHVKRSDVPTAGQMHKSANPEFDAASYDADLAERQKSTLY